MKTLPITCICSIALAIGAFGQSPTISPVASPPPASPFPTASMAPTASVIPSPSATAPMSAVVGASASATPSTLADRIHQRIDKKIKKKGFHIGVDTDDKATDETGNGSHEDIPAMVIPLVGIVFLTIFGAPVLIVAVIMYFGFSRNRMMHRTVRMMVEKGQPVPESLLNPPPAVRKRSDMRRGVVLVMVGLGLVIFLGAVNDWEGGSWAIGIIPFLIGLGYLLVWKLEGSRDNPPPLP